MFPNPNDESFSIEVDGANITPFQTMNSLGTVLFEMDPVNATEINADQSIFPNPSNGTFTIEVSLDSIYQIVLFSPLGERILEKQFELIADLDISSFENGIYFLRITNLANGSVSMKPIIKN